MKKILTIVAALCIAFWAVIIVYAQTLVTSQHWEIPTIGFTGPDITNVFNEITSAVYSNGSNILNRANFQPSCEWYAVIHGTMDANTNCTALTVEVHSSP